MSATELTWPQKQDGDWADTFTWHAAWATAARKDDIRGWLDIVHEAVVDSGSTAEELFGPARDAAETFAQDLPPEQRAAGDLDEGTWSDLPRTLLAMAGWFLMALGIARLVSEGGSTGLTAPGAVVFAAVVLAAGGLGTASLAWRSGRPIATGAWILASVAVVGVTIYAAMELLDRERSIGSAPTIVLPAIGVALLVVWWRLPERKPAIDDSSRTWPAERWFTRMEWLLRGRHKMPRETARRLTAETRAHAEETGEHPFESFGPPQVHALALAEADLRTVVYRVRSERRWHLLFAIFAAAVVVTNVVSGNVDWSTWFFGAAGLLALLLALPRGERTTAG